MSRRDSLLETLEVANKKPNVESNIILDFKDLKDMGDNWSNMEKDVENYQHIVKSDLYYIFLYII